MLEGERTKLRGERYTMAFGESGSCPCRRIVFLSVV